tara:strand:+ start:79 stop:414 length:336 start_codon:yes stop_codon:yes gene_type:complete
MKELTFPYYILEVNYALTPKNHFPKESVILDTLIFEKKKDAINYLKDMNSRSLTNYTRSYFFILKKVEEDCKACKSIKTTNIKLPEFKKLLRIIQDNIEKEERKENKCQAI